MATLIRLSVFCFKFRLNLLYLTFTDSSGLSDQSPLSQLHSVLFCALATKQNSPGNRRLKTTGEYLLSVVKCHT